MSHEDLNPIRRNAERSRLRAMTRTALQEALVFMFYFALAVFVTRPLIGHLRTRTLGYSDPYVDMWTIDWLSEHFFEPREIFQGNTFAPEPHAVLYSDLSLGTVVLMLPFRLVIDDPVPLYNLAVLLALAFGGWAFHALVRDLTGNRAAGLLAGMLSAFCSHQMHHVYHLNLLTIGWLALFLLGLHRILKRPTVGSILLTGGAFALNAQSSGYYGVAAILVAVVFASMHARTLLQRRRLMGVAGAMGIAAILTLPYAASYMKLRAHEHLHRPISMSERMSFMPHRDLGHDGYVYRRVLSFGGEELFPGLLALVLAAVAVVRRPKNAVLYMIAAALCLVIALGPEARLGSCAVPLPFALLHKIPPFDGMRHPFTFAAVSIFMIAVLAGIGFAGLRIPSRSWTATFVVALAALEIAAPRRILQDVPWGLPRSYAMLRSYPKAPILEIPLYSEEALLWAARHGMPMVNGQGSAFVPLRIRSLGAMINNQWIRRSPRSIDATKPTRRLREIYERLYLIVPSGRKPDLAPLADALRRSASFSLLAVTAERDHVFVMCGPRDDAGLRSETERLVCP
jgi:hypothetical protein